MFIINIALVIPIFNYNINYFAVFTKNIDKFTVHMYNTAMHSKLVKGDKNI